MFEYFMPLLVMRAYPGTLLDETYRAVVERQIQYGAAARRAVGHLRVGVQRAGPRAQLSVPGVRRAGARPEARPRPTTWSSPRTRRMLAAPLVPLDVAAQPRAADRARAWPAATASTRRSTTRPSGTPDGAPRRRAADLHGAPPGHEPGRARQRAARRPDAAAVPRGSARPGRRPAAAGAHPAPGAAEEPADRNRGARAVGARRAAPSVRRYATPHTLSPRAHLLSNGSYVVMVTNAGGGYSRRQQIALTRWREDVTTDALGQLLLRPRPRHRRRLVDDLPADRAGARRVRGDLRAGPRRLPPPRRRHRDPHRNRRLAGRRCGAAPRLGDQSQRRAPAASS